MLHNALKSQHRIHTGHYGKIHYTYFDAVVQHDKLGHVKLVFLHTHKELLVFISTHLSYQEKRLSTSTKSVGISNKATKIYENTLV